MHGSSTALSNLRAFVILIVVAFHSVLAYQGHSPAASAPFDDPPYLWLATPIIDSDRWFGFDLFCAFQYDYLMHFMFFLSGLFVWPSLKRRGSGPFLYERFMRLGVPFVLGVYLLMPIAHYPVYRVTATDPSWSAFWQHWTALPFWTSGPLWFLWFLLGSTQSPPDFTGLRPAPVNFSGDCRQPGMPIRAATISGWWRFRRWPMCRSPPCSQPWDWVRFGPFNFQPSFALHYVVFFFAGSRASGSVGWKTVCSDGPVAPGEALGGCGSPPRSELSWLWIIPTALVFQGYAVPGLKIGCGSWLGAGNGGELFRFRAAVFVALRRQALGRSADSLSANAYGIYLIHYVFVTWLQYALLGVALFAIAKASDRLQRNAHIELGSECGHQSDSDRRASDRHRTAPSRKGGPGQRAGGMTRPRAVTRRVSRHPRKRLHLRQNDVIGRHGTSRAHARAGARQIRR